jgi:hypothetical protein
MILKGKHSLVFKHRANLLDNIIGGPGYEGVVLLGGMEW